MPEVNENTVADLRARIAAVRSQIENAARRSGRVADEIRLVAVSKTHPSEILKAAIESGATDFGENRVQEAEAKIAEIGREAVTWHLIGNLQANKARKAVRLFDLIHSLDSIELAERLERVCGEENRENLDVLIQVDLAGEATKSGVPETDLPALVEFLKNCSHLKLRGLMILPPFFEDAERVRPFFRHLREIRDRVFGDERAELSMGMSHDFEIAVEEGATIVRVGTAIFGERGNPKSQI
ncbi:MAG: YggS family pyridoxal phosphate-dependent enzyme [Acidobacteriota bacterium]|nr:YggS family pyridoxal phosphate-dependent enzyme [Acidobacteriota bacterium]